MRLFPVLLLVVFCLLLLPVIFALPHTQYPVFSSPESRVSLGASDTSITVSDTIVYHTAYYNLPSSDEWVSFSLGDNFYSNSDSWLDGAGFSDSLPRFPANNESYILYYSCTLISNQDSESGSSWDCHNATGSPNGFWQLLVINNSDSVFSQGDCSLEEYYFSDGDVCLLDVPGNTYFVAPWGDDANDGTFTHPWGTWGKAFHNVRSGDIAYFSGGTYLQDGEVTYNPLSGRGYVGTASHPVRFYNYPGEYPILDFSAHTQTHNTIVGLALSNSNYVYLKGLTVTSLHQIVDAQWIAGIITSNISVLSFEEVVSKDHGGSGFFLQNYDSLNLTNCDSYDNIDYTSTGIPGGRADGFNIASGGSSSDLHKIAYVTGCRSWNNSDDGFDFGTTKQIQVKNTWSFLNGRLQGDGNAFKLSYSNIRDPKLRRIHHSIAANNSATGFEVSNLASITDGPVLEYSNNLVYRCMSGFRSAPGSWDSETYPTGKDVMYNNWVYDSHPQYPWLGQAWLYAAQGNPVYVTAYNNTWRRIQELYWAEDEPAYTVSEDDFLSLDVAQLMRPRKADGSLPDITFGHLAQGSDLIDGGTVIDGFHCPTAGVHPDLDCVEWFGAAPDLGPFESQQAAIPCTDCPRVVSESFSDQSGLATVESPLVIDGALRLSSDAAASLLDDPNLVSAYLFQDPVALGTDTLGNNDMSLVRGDPQQSTTVPSGMEGFSIALAGSDQVCIASGFSFDPSSDHSLCFWARKSSSTDTGNVFAQHCTYDTWSSAGDYRFTSNNCVSAQNVYVADVYVANEWSHVCQSYDTSEQLMTFFVDGALVHQEVFADPIALNAQTWCIGGCDNGCFMQGFVFEPLWFSDLLSSEEVAGIFEGTYSCVPSVSASATSTTFSEELVITNVSSLSYSLSSDDPSNSVIVEFSFDNGVSWYSLDSGETLNNPGLSKNLLYRVTLNAVVGNISIADLSFTYAVEDIPVECSVDQTRQCGDTDVGACVFGTESCILGLWSGTCEGYVAPTAELCNAYDDDCDGQTNEGLSRQTSCGVGVCSGNTGVESCDLFGNWVGDTCNPYEGAVAEICDNGLDDDCDGLIDGADFSDCNLCDAGSDGQCPSGCSYVDGDTDCPQIVSLIADHTVVDDFDSIPSCWLDQVRTMTYLYVGESHSGAIPNGFSQLEAMDAARYAYTIYPGIGLYVPRTHSAISSGTYIGEALIWTNQNARNNVDAALTDLQPDAFGWGWCWDLTRGTPSLHDTELDAFWYGSTAGGPDGDRHWGLDDADYSLTSNSVSLQTYLDAFATLQAAHPNVAVLYQTGPVEGSAELGAAGYQRYLKHERIREWVRDGDGLYLLDYADILTHGLDGSVQTTTWTSSVSGTTYTFPTIHPDSLGGEYTSHIGEVGALRVAKANWWLLARIAGWNGLPEGSGANACSS